MMENTNKNQRHLLGDVILIVALLAVAAVVMACLHLFRKSGDTVKVAVDGELYGVYPLSQDMTEDIITGEDGGRLNRLVIRDGKAYVETATCPDGICAAHRAVDKDGESIVCLPHRVVITVVADETDGAPDAVV